MVDPSIFSTIDWNAPWLLPYKTIGVSLAKKVGLGCSVHEALNNWLDSDAQISSGARCPVRFVPQEKSAGALAYEAFIWQTKTVPTRDNLHDFFNGLVWLHFPAIKTKLNALQAAAIKAEGIKTSRGKLRDALTLFDENAAFLLEPNCQFNLLQAISDKAWQVVFIQNRIQWKHAQLIIFGHALLEKLMRPRKAMTAHVYCPTTVLPNLEDDTIAALLTPEHLLTKPFAPLPVLGVPAWCSHNECPDFYDDKLVFRPLHQPVRQPTPCIPSETYCTQSSEYVNATAMALVSS